MLLTFGEAGSIDIADREKRIKLVEATLDGTIELPVVGAVETPAAILIRPDGHVAWVKDGNPGNLGGAIAKWF